MDHLLQLYQPSLSNFSIVNPICTPIQFIQTSSIYDKNNNDDKEITSFIKKHLICTHPNCGKSFRFKSEFTRHKLTHVAQGLINCPVEGCTKTFKRDDILKTHMRTHTGETPYKCEEPGCGQSFTYKASLSYHILKHTVGKGYKCSFPGCNKVFLTLSQLKTHKNTIICHQRLSNQVPLQDENEEHLNNVKVRRCENTIFSAGPTTQEANSIKLEVGAEMKYKIINNENTSTSLEKKFKTMVKALVYENSIMKMKLNMLHLRNLEIKYTKELRQLSVQQFSNERTSAYFNFEVKSE